MGNFVSYSNATDLMTAIGQKFAALSGAYIFKGSSTFANLPAQLTDAMTGYVYNMSEEFTTDSRFIEGAGKKYPAGTNVAVANVGSVSTPDMKFDVIGAFVDVDAIMDAIKDVSDMISEEFDDTAAYAIGDIVVYEGALYKFKAAHAAGAWAAADVDEVTVDDLIKALEASIATVSGRVNTVVGDLADAFDSTQAYAIGDVVTYQDGLYKFKAAHTASDPWSSSEVDAVTVESLISSAEPDELTSAQVDALIALL